MARAEKTLRAQIIVEPGRPFSVRTLAFTCSEMSSLSMVLHTGSHLGFKRLILAVVFRVSNRRESVAQSFSNQGAQLITSSDSALQRGNTSLGSIYCKF